MDRKQLAQAKKVFETWTPSPEKKLATYLTLFKEQFEKFKDSDRAKIKGLTEHDLYSLGSVLERQATLKPMTEEVSFSQLGAAPTIAYDFITALFGKSVIPYVASEQVIDEVQGLVYFENIIAASTRGNIAADDALGKAAGVPDKYPQGFAGEMVYGEVAEGAEGDGSTTEFSFTLTYGPVRPNYVKVMCDTVSLVDDGKGNLIGVGGYGTITYSTGEVEVTFLTAPETDATIVSNANPSVLLLK